MRFLRLSDYCLVGDRFFHKLNQPLTIERSDALLVPFIEALDYSLAESLLTKLIQEHAGPVIARILKSKLRVSLSNSHVTQENQDASEIAGPCGPAPGPFFPCAA